MLGKTDAEISPFPESFPCCGNISIQFSGTKDGDFRDFQFWRREPPYHRDNTDSLRKNTALSKKKSTFLWWAFISPMERN